LINPHTHFRMSLQRLKEITTHIGKCLSEQFDKDNPDEVIGKIQEFSALLGLSSESYALAEMVYNEKILELSESSQYAKLNATDKKMIFAGRAKQEIYYLTLTERQNKSLTHSLDALRSIISFIKQDKLNSQFQQA